MATDSGLEQRLKEIFDDTDAYYIYGDLAYQSLDYIVGPYPGGKSLQGLKRHFNKCMSSVRISVEQVFGLTQNLWITNAFKSQLKALLQPVAAYYMTAVLLTNCYTCIKDNQVGKQFEIQPPSLHEYLITTS